MENRHHVSRAYCRYCRPASACKTGSYPRGSASRDLGGISGMDPGFSQKIMCAHHVREARSPLRPGSMQGRLRALEALRVCDALLCFLSLRGDAGELSHFFRFRQHFCKFTSWVEMFLDTWKYNYHVIISVRCCYSRSLCSDAFFKRKKISQVAQLSLCLRRLEPPCK